MNEYKYISFIELEPKPKTKVFMVINKSLNTLGFIKWHAPWRRYVFIVDAAGNFFDAKCLADIQGFINRLMLERRKK
jgi:hypothetical protein